MHGEHLDTNVVAALGRLIAIQHLKGLNICFNHSILKDVSTLSSGSVDESLFFDYAPSAFQQVHVQFWCAISWDTFVVFALAVIRPDCAFLFAAGHPLRLRCSWYRRMYSVLPVC